MPSQCVAWNCMTRREGDESDDQTVTFHSFPTTRPELLAKWLACLGEPFWKPQRGSVLCSKHFDRSSFLQNYATPRLRQDAVPIHCEKRPHGRGASDVPDLDRSTTQSLQPDAPAPPSPSKKQRIKRKVLRHHDPEEEIASLRQMLEDERTKRRDLEQEIYRLRQEKSEMISKMTKLEASKCKPNIPQSLIPILVDAMAKNVDPLKKPDFSRVKARAAGNAAPRMTKPRVAPRPAATTTTTTVTTDTPPLPQKLMLQLPEQILDTNSSKSVSFIVPVSSSTPSTSSGISVTGQVEGRSAAADGDTSLPEVSQNEMIALD